MTNDLLARADWLRSAGCGPVVMASTGSSWRPVFNLLEEHCEVLVVNAYHAKAVPGRKTDGKDAEWLADLLRHGLLRASFIPSPAQRHLRDLTRYRIHLVDERARLTNRLQAVLEDANSKLAAVVTEVRGLSAREILPRLRGGETDARALAELAHGQLRAKREALAQAVVGRREAHHVFPARVSSLLTGTTWMRPARAWTRSSQRVWRTSEPPSPCSRLSPALPGALPKCSSPRLAPT
jgi:transposase